MNKYQTVIFGSNVPAQQSQKWSDHTKKIYSLRHQNDLLRERTAKGLFSIFESLRGKHQMKNILNDQKYLISMLSPQNTSQFLRILGHFYSQIQGQVQETSSVNQQLHHQIEDRKRQLQQLKRQITHKSIAIDQTKLSIQTLCTKLNQENLLVNQSETDYKLLQCQSLQKQLAGTSYFSSEKLDQIQRNWKSYRDQIQQIILQRTQINQKCNLIQKASQLLTKKLEKHTFCLEEHKRKTQINHTLKEENDQLNKELSQQRKRKQKLQKVKMMKIIFNQVEASSQVVGKWDLTKKQAQKMLMGILNKINEKLPVQKLENINEIIQEAEYHYKRSELSQRKAWDLTHSQHLPNSQIQQGLMSEGNSIQDRQIEKQHQQRRRVSDSLIVNSSQISPIHQISSQESHKNRMMEDQNQI